MPGGWGLNPATRFRCGWIDKTFSVQRSAFGGAVRTSVALLVQDISPGGAPGALNVKRRTLNAERPYRFRLRCEAVATYYFNSCS